MKTYLHMAVGSLALVLRIRFESSARTDFALNPRAISSVFNYFLKKIFGSSVVVFPWIFWELGRH